MMSSLTALTSDRGKSPGILMVGLDGAGKTTILYKLKYNKNVTTISTLGFNAEPIEIKNKVITLWDIGGSKTIRLYWKSFISKCKGLTFVVDSTNKDRFSESRMELESMLQENEISKFPILVLANKQDTDKAATIDEVGEALGLCNQIGKNIKIMGSSGRTSEGLQDGLDWIIKEINS